MDVIFSSRNASRCFLRGVPVIGLLLLSACLFAPLLRAQTTSTIEGNVTDHRGWE
jgi:hypothetical protein